MDKIKEIEDEVFRILIRTSEDRIPLFNTAKDIVAAILKLVDPNKQSVGKTFDYLTTAGKPCKITLEPGWDGEIVDGVLTVNPTKTSDKS